MPSPKQDRAVRTKQAILRAAAEVVNEQGFGNAGIAKIAERAGTTTGSIYFHFRAKEGLMSAIMNAQPQTIVSQLNAAGLQRLVDITLVWCQQLRTDPMLRAGVRMAVEQGAFGLQDDTSFHEWQTIMEECLREARACGELQEHVDPAEIAELVVGACTGSQLHSKLSSQHEDLTVRVVRLWRYLLPSIAMPGVAGRIELHLDRGPSAGE
ncbi:ScbR family autoregulator-binding transcription factor [Streptomyces sp. NPDC002790]|uniref:ScbR family autoregulator-binding transcription factor n=1 Tax=Streptomyces sp. NPDC002790 TaxID=3154431 RepID=UPI003318E250